MKHLALLVGAGLLLSAAAGLLGGIQSLVGGIIATGCQFIAVAILRKKMTAPTREFMARWFGGVGVRLAGLVMTLLVLSPVAGGLAFIGVLLPLLFTETVFLK